jgi:hypothetical protein
MLKLTRLLTFGLMVYTFGSQAQGIFNNPDSLYQAGNLSLAAVAYEKKIFDLQNTNLAENASDIDLCYARLAEIARYTQDYALAYSHLSRIQTDSIAALLDIGYKKVFYSYLAGDFATSELEAQLARSPNIQDLRIDALLALSLNELSKWEEAYEICRKSLYPGWQATTPEKISVCDSLYTHKPKFKKAKKAEILNLVFPGAGYAYIGRTKDALVSAGLQVFSVGLAGLFVWQKLYATAGLIGLGLYAKFRQGSAGRVVNLTREVNDRKKYHYNTALKNLILTN